LPRCSTARPDAPQAIPEGLVAEAFLMRHPDTASDGR
jgi:hypothetical protein